MAEVFFFLAAIGALAGALGTILLRNPFYSVLALVCHLLSLAALFLLLRAEFVAAAQGSGYFRGFGTAEEMGRLFLTDFLLAFEAASLLLLIAAVGAVILARRRTGLEDAREISVADLMRDPQYKGTLGDAERGTLLEAGGPPH